MSYCKTIKSRYSPIISKRKYGIDLVGYYLISGNLHLVGLPYVNKEALVSYFNRYLIVSSPAVLGDRIRCCSMCDSLGSYILMTGDIRPVTSRSLYCTVCNNSIHELL